MKDLLLYLWNANHHYAHQLLEVIPEDKMADQPAGLPNHPAWTLAHLSIAGNNLLVPALGGKPLDLAGWETKYGYGSKPTQDRTQYPSKNELIQTYDEVHRIAAEGIKSSFDQIVGVVTPDEGTRSYFPTLDKLVAYMTSIHEANHLGQLADWRRAMGMKTVL
jgi:hypothetical protein